MKPTANLRFVERYEINDTHDLEKIKVLQQWWACDPDSYEDWIMRVNGEWRDVPCEQE